MLKRLIAGITLAAALATGYAVVSPAPAQADTGWPCPGC